ncbi:MAG: DUF3500 domain-containing protein [Planctomycetes bacterium]|nr:DUF3500 domain-containing protein [Planctomycetota bacterium]MCB9901399.1 DUF3500 domain-containing protein [Planctomycetota bacterium]
MRVPQVHRFVVAAAALLAIAMADAPSASCAESRDPVAAAQAFLASLDAPRRRVAHLGFGAPERLEWEYRPGPRAGIPIGRLTPLQRAAAEALWQSGLAAEGLRRIGAVLLRERILQASVSASARQQGWRDPGLYHLAVFGAPAADQRWSWRLDGHHLSVHLTYIGSRLVSSSPSFLGGNPASTREDGGHVAHATLAAWRALHASLDDRQRAAVYGGARIPGDIVMQPGARRASAPTSGLDIAALDERQQTLLLAVLATYAVGARDGEPGLPRTAADLAGVRLRVRGDPQAVRAHHVEIAGPRFAAEHRDPGGHVHLLWRTELDHGGR